MRALGDRGVPLTWPEQKVTRDERLMLTEYTLEAVIAPFETNEITDQFKEL
jgi:hypothetical protein